jgi:sucrose-6-phosphate hydrolase SacC (GH32 family)
MSETLACMSNWDRFELMEPTSDGWRQTSVPRAEKMVRAGGKLHFPQEMDVKVVDPDTGNGK